MEDKSETEHNPNAKLSPIGRVLRWLILIFALYLVASSVMNNHSRTHGEHIAIESLRFLGNAQWSYVGMNAMKGFGSISALQEAGLINIQADETTLIPGYKVEWNFWNDLRESSFSDGPPRNKFQIIAYPASKFMLRTFAITEDEIVRVYSESSGNDREDVYSWDAMDERH